MESSLTQGMQNADRVESTMLVARHIEINTHTEPVLFLRTDSPVARSEGFEAMSRVRVSANGHSIVATLLTVGESLLPKGQAGLSDAALDLLDIADGEQIELSHPKPLSSLSTVRSKIYGNELDAGEMRTIVDDVVAGRYMDVHLAAFITACAGRHMTQDEIIHLTRAMVESGETLDWSNTQVVDKHCVGGLPGNRTTPIVVAIAAARGLVMPKTSSRAITSPSGTADTMETLAPVDLDIPTLRHVVEREGACIAWGGSVNLSPADDILIRIERALEARDVLAVLKREPGAPNDLRDRAVSLAGTLLEAAGVSEPGSGASEAQKTLADGSAWLKFQAICEAQGGMREPPHAPYRYDVFADRDGVVTRIDNRIVSRIARLAGAPADKAAGLEMAVRVRSRVASGDVMMTLHAESPGELEYALDFQRAHPEAIELEED